MVVLSGRYNGGGGCLRRVKFLRLKIALHTIKLSPSNDFAESLPYTIVRLTA